MEEKEEEEELGLEVGADSYAAKSWLYALLGFNQLHKPRKAR